MAEEQSVFLLQQALSAGSRGQSRLTTDSAMSQANELVDAAIANAYKELKHEYGFTSPVSIPPRHQAILTNGER